MVETARVASLTAYGGPSAPAERGGNRQAARVGVKLAPGAGHSTLDDPETTAGRRRIIHEKRLLQDIYRDWYTAIASSMPAGPEPVLELGSGAGFMGTYVDRLIASDILRVPGLDLVLDACQIPLADRSLKAIAMTNVLHHVHDVESFFREAARVVRPGGALVMIEPWVTPWSRVIYGRLHHEPFHPDAADWRVLGSGPLSAANGALPWILFERDRARFEREFPAWRVASIHPGMPLRYLLSGGFTWRGMMPPWTSGTWRLVEKGLGPLASKFGMFARIVVSRSHMSPTN
jgi:SAM-dependent methyltransferase